MTSPSQVRIAIIPGNGGGNVQMYGSVKRALHHPPAVECVLRNMPDPLYARETVWLPFMRDELKCDERTIIIGHSSGAAAAMRYAEVQKVAGIVLVSAYTTDQGDEVERTSGYFSRPWPWDKIRSNAGFVVQFASDDDPFLPIEEQLEVAQGLQAELHRYEDRGHFMDEVFPELVEAVQTRVRDIMKREEEA